MTELFLKQFSTEHFPVSFNYFRLLTLSQFTFLLQTTVGGMTVHRTGNQEIVGWTAQ